MHKSITMDRVIQLCEQRETSLDNPGICRACGEEAFDCEPDSRNYECESCGKNEVFGAEEYLFMVLD